VSGYLFLAICLALLASSTDWSPVVLALAGLIVASTPAVVGLVVSLSNRAAIAKVSTQVDSHLSAVSAELAAVREQAARQQQVIVAQATGKDVLP
jgi:hypothetical protein